MMKLRWPWTLEDDRERRDSSYTDALVASITANAAGQTTAFATATAALEACAGLVGRSFSACEVSGPDRVVMALPPSMLNMIGRALIRRGEFVALVEVSEGMLYVIPAASWTVYGGEMPDEWTYRLNLAGPKRQRTMRKVMAAQVLHIMYGADPETAWRGMGPLQVAQLAGRLSAETVAALADEASGPRGHLMPAPVDGEDSTIDELKTDIRGLKGSLALLEGGDWAATNDASAKWEAKRIGANPPDALIEQLSVATAEVYAACGVNPAIFRDAQGTAGREAWRQVLFGLIAPLGRLVQYELSMKLDAPDLVLDWHELRASDISGRARAFQSLVGGGMDVNQAATLSGVLSPDSA